MKAAPGVPEGASVRAVAAVGEEPQAVAPQRFDWPVLLRAGLSGLRLSPAAFWALTPAELQLMLGAGAVPAMRRARLDELLARWPDRPAGAGTGQEEAAE